MKFDLRSVDKIKLAWVAGGIFAFTAAVLLALYSTSYAERFFMRAATGVVTPESGPAAWTFIRRGAILGKAAVDGKRNTYLLLVKAPDRAIVPIVMADGADGATPALAALSSGTRQGRTAMAVNRVFATAARGSPVEADEDDAWLQRSMLLSVNLTVQTLLEYSREAEEASDE